MKLSDLFVESGGSGVPESDNLEGSAVDLGIGYSQSMWIREYIIRDAGRRGLSGSFAQDTSLAIQE